MSVIVELLCCAGKYENCFDKAFERCCNKFGLCFEAIAIRTFQLIVVCIPITFIAGVVIFYNSEEPDLGLAFLNMLTGLLTLFIIYKIIKTIHSYIVKKYRKPSKTSLIANTNLIANTATTTNTSTIDDPEEVTVATVVDQCEELPTK